LDPAEYWLDGPALELVVSFPRPRLSSVERWDDADAQRHWNAVLQNLPPQNAALRIAGRPPGVVRVADVCIPNLDPGDQERYVGASLAANGQSASEIAADMRFREAEVERLAGGSSFPREPIEYSGGQDQEASDGSLF
jgi:hypothetical protein